MENKVDQICEKCGKVFQRSRWHPQIVTCPDCKDKKQKHCVYCENSCKKEWMLWCPIKNRDVTDGCNGVCHSFKERKYTNAQKKEIEDMLKLTGGR